MERSTEPGGRRSRILSRVFPATHELIVARARSGSLAKSTDVGAAPKSPFRSSTQPGRSGSPVRGQRALATASSAFPRAWIAETRRPKSRNPAIVSLSADGNRRTFAICRAVSPRAPAHAMARVPERLTGEKKTFFPPFPTSR